VTTQATGVIKNVFVKEGDSVNTGQKIEEKLLVKTQKVLRLNYPMVVAKLF